MSERGKHRTTYVSAGSNTTIKSTPGSLYSINVQPQNGAVVLVVDNPNLGTTPDYNVDTATGLIGRFGTYTGTAPDIIAFAGIGFDALTVAATSNTRLVVEYE